MMDSEDEGAHKHRRVTVLVEILHGSLIEPRQALQGESVDLGWTNKSGALVPLGYLLPGSRRRLWISHTWIEKV